jgi:hypothetical protein
MSKFVISFGADAMVHIPDEDMRAVADAAHAVVREMLNFGVYVFAGGLVSQRASIVATDGAITEGPEPQVIGGFTIIEVPTRAEALEWTAKIASACRCAQTVWEIGHDPELETMLGHTDGLR